MRAALALLVVTAAGCKDDAAPKVAPTPPVSTTKDAAASDATIGPILDLVACAPAPVAPGEPEGKGTTFPRVTLGPTTTSGGSLGKAAVADVLRKHENRLRFCYEQNLGRRPTLAGDTQLSIIIEAKGGNPFEVIVDKGIDDELSLCLKHIVSELQFPKPPKNDRSTIVQPLTFTWTAGKLDTRAGEPAAWLPYATSGALVPTEIAVPAALGLQKVMPTAKLATCLAAQTGTLRTIARIGLDGSVIEARAGGLGDRAAEACIGAALVGVKTEPVSLITEVACDFVRGDPAPWRIAPDSYTVIDTAQKPDRAAQPKAGETFLVLVDPATPASALASALATAVQGAGYVVAMRVDSGPPLFLLAGRPRGAIADPSAPLTLDAREPLRLCNGLLDAPLSAPFADGDKLLAQAARRCTHKPCPTLLTITLANERTADEVAQLVAAARRAGFERIRLGAGSCPQ